MNEADIVDVREPDPEVAAYHREVRERFDRICNEMLAGGWRADRMTAYRLHRVEEVKQTQIAAIVKKSVGWVNQAIHSTETEVRRRWGEANL
jgi:hypothetical protein